METGYRREADGYRREADGYRREADGYRRVTGGYRRKQRRDSKETGISMEEAACSEQKIFKKEQGNNSEQLTKENTGNTDIAAIAEWVSE